MELLASDRERKKTLMRIISEERLRDENKNSEECTYHDFIIMRII